jgi:hypothetical protein
MKITISSWNAPAPKKRLDASLSLLFSALHLYGSRTKQRIERLRYILIFNQTKNGVTLFYLPNAE